MKKVIAAFILFLFSISYLFAQTNFQQNELVGVKLNGKVLIPAKYRSIIHVGNLFLVTTVNGESKVIDIKDKDIIGASQTIDVLNSYSSIIYSVKLKGDSLFYLTDQKGKRISKKGYNNAQTLFYSYPATSEYLIGFRKDTSDIYFNGKLIFTKNCRIEITGKGPLNKFLIVKETKEKNIIAIDTSGHQVAVTKGENYLIKNSYLVVTTVEKTADGYPSFLYSVYDKNLKFVFQTNGFIEPMGGKSNLFVSKKLSFGIIDSTQKVIVPFKYNDYKLVSVNKKPYVLMRNDMGKWTLYNEKCEVLSDGTYVDIKNSENEYAIILMQHRTNKDIFLYGLIDSNASLIIHCRFDKIEFNEQKGTYIFNVQGKAYEYRIAEIANNKVKINSLVKPVQ